VVEPSPRGRNPFDQTGGRSAERPAAASRAYHRDLPGSPRRAPAAASVRGGTPSATAAGWSWAGDRSTYRELWDRAARVGRAGLGQGGAVPARRTRVAIRPGERDRLGAPAFLRRPARRSGSRCPSTTPLHRGRGGLYVIEDSGASFTFSAQAELPDGPPAGGSRNLGPEEPCGDLLTTRRAPRGFPKGRHEPRSRQTSRPTARNAIRCLVPSSAPRAPGISTLVSVPLFPNVTGCNKPADPDAPGPGGRVEILASALDLEGFFAAVGSHGVNQPRVRGRPIYHAVIGPSAASPSSTSAGVSLGLLRRAASDRREPRCGRIEQAFPNAAASATAFGLNGDLLADGRSCPQRGGRRGTPTRSAFADWPVVDPRDRMGADPETRVGQAARLRGPKTSVAGYWNRPEAHGPRRSWTAGCTPGDVGADRRGTVSSTSSTARRDMINRGGRERVLRSRSKTRSPGAPGVGEGRRWVAVARRDDGRGRSAR